jgi:hypothetical protein
MTRKLYEPKMTEEEFEGLHKAIDETRKSAGFVKVEKKALEHLLMDHAELWVALERT